MKTLLKLQQKLSDALKHQSALQVSLKVPCTEQEFREVAWVVQDFVNQNGDVTNEDPLYSWLEEYQFFLSQQ